MWLCAMRGDPQIFINKCLHNPSRISLISPLRGRRPDLFRERSKCPFCPGSEELTPKAVLVARNVGGRLQFTRDGEKGYVRGWVTRVFPNMYPVLHPNPEFRPAALGAESTYGYHEVLVETGIHEESKYLANYENIYYALLTLRRRLQEIFRDPYIESVIAVKNGGVGGGASIPHPHMQIFAFTFTPPELMNEVSSFRSGECPLRGLIGNAVLTIKDYGSIVLAVSPAPRSPYELIVLPKRHEPSYLSTNDETLKDLARALQASLKFVREVIRKDYNLWIHTAPRGIKEYHWHVELLPITSTWGGLEKGGYVYLVTKPPKEAAEEIRKYLRDRF